MPLMIREPFAWRRRLECVEVIRFQHLELDRQREIVGRAAPAPPDQALAGFDDGPHDEPLQPVEIGPPVRIARRRVGPARPAGLHGLIRRRRTDPPADRIVDDGRHRGFGIRVVADQIAHDFPRHGQPGFA